MMQFLRWLFAYLLCIITVLVVRRYWGFELATLVGIAMVYAAVKEK